MKRRDQKCLVSLFLLAFFTVWGTMFLFSESSFQRLQHFTVQKPEFRRQSLSAPMQRLSCQYHGSGKRGCTVLDGNGFFR